MTNQIANRDPYYKNGADCYALGMGRECQYPEGSIAEEAFFAGYDAAAEADTGPYAPANGWRIVAWGSYHTGYPVISDSKGQLFWSLLADDTGHTAPTMRVFWCRGTHTRPETAHARRITEDEAQTILESHRKNYRHSTETFAARLACKIRAEDNRKKEAA